MKRILRRMYMVISLAMVISMVALLSTTSPLAQEFVYTYKSEKGNVVFDHEKHKAASKCEVCHVVAGNKIVVTKDYAHGTCRECHRGKVDNKCSTCHKSEQKK